MFRRTPQDIKAPCATSPSCCYGWHDLDDRTFNVLGVLARRAPDGTPRFNFSQTVWIHPRVDMNWSARMNRSVQTLAVNILVAFQAIHRQQPTSRAAAAARRGTGSGVRQALSVHDARRWRLHPV